MAEGGSTKHLPFQHFLVIHQGEGEINPTPKPTQGAETCEAAKDPKIMLLNQRLHAGQQMCMKLSPTDGHHFGGIMVQKVWWWGTLCPDHHYHPKC